MKYYYPDEKHINHYKKVGKWSIVVAVIILLIAPLGRINNIQKIFFIALLIGIPALYVTRTKRLVLTIDQEELTFNDGMLSRAKVDLNRINYVEYHPELKIRIYTFAKKRKPITILNVFSLEDQQDILATLKSKRHRIEIHYLEKPSRVITKVNNNVSEDK